MRLDLCRPFGAQNFEMALYFSKICTTHIQCICIASFTPTDYTQPLSIPTPAQQSQCYPTFGFIYFPTSRALWGQYNHTEIKNNPILIYSFFSDICVSMLISASPSMASNLIQGQMQMCPLVRHYCLTTEILRCSCYNRNLKFQSIMCIFQSQNSRM